MKHKIALFAFNGEPMCFTHVLLNAMEYRSKDYEVKIIIEGQATGVINEIRKKENAYHALYEKTKALGLIDCVCNACATKMKSLEAANEEGLNICDEMSGHPSMARYMDEGFQIITF